MEIALFHAYPDFFDILALCILHYLHFIELKVLLNILLDQNGFRYSLLDLSKITIKKIYYTT